MDPLYKKRSFTRRQRSKLLSRYLDISCQDEALQRCNDKLDALMDPYSELISSLSAEDRELLQKYDRAVMDMSNAVSAIAYRMGVADGIRHMIRRMQRFIR